MIKNSDTASTGIATAKMSDILAFIVIAIAVAKISIAGPRTKILITVINAICVFVTSVVSLVTSEAVEYLSTL